MRVNSGKKTDNYHTFVKIYDMFSHKNNFLLPVVTVQGLRRESHNAKSNLLLKNPHSKDKNCEFTSRAFGKKVLP
jgi:hypothetical protein